jgi:cytochrome c peroxidase
MLAVDAGGQIDSGGQDDAPAEGSHALCSRGQSTDGTYPKVEYRVDLLSTPPDLAFEAPEGTIALRDYFEPCAAMSRLLIVRVGAPWCGTCLWHLRHNVSELTSLDIGPRLRWLDLVLSNTDNDPPVMADLDAYKALIDAPDKVALDPAYQFGALSPIRASLPLFVLVDTRTMQIRNFLNDPDPQFLELRIRQELAALDGAPPPAAPPQQKFDGLFFRNQWDMLHEMTLPGAPPPDPTNIKADDAVAAALGKQLFSDTALSPSGKVSCASCHDPLKQFQDGLPQSTAGVAPVDRNAPAIALAAHARWQFWDGRADTLWMQALGPLENPKEFGSSRLFVAHAVAVNYAPSYAAVFGALADLSDANRFPANGKPGDPSWQAMAVADQQTVSDIFVNVGKAIAAYERTLRVQPNRLDAYVAGDLSALSGPEKTGLHTFFSASCAECHWGPRLTDDAFHPDRYPTGRQDGQADRGRIDGVTQLLASEFAQPHPGLTARASQLGSFKTPTLRGVAGSAPYGHGGTLATLLDTATNYGTAGLPPSDPRAVGATEPWLVEFGQGHAADLVPFLQVLTAEPVP